MQPRDAEAKKGNDCRVVSQRLPSLGLLKTKRGTVLTHTELPWRSYSERQWMSMQTRRREPEEGWGRVSRRLHGPEL